MTKLFKPLLKSVSDFWRGRKPLSETFWAFFIIGNGVWFFAWGKYVFANQCLSQWMTLKLIEGHERLYIYYRMIEACGLMLFVPVSCLVMWRCVKHNCKAKGKWIGGSLLTVTLLFSFVAWPYLAWGTLWFGVMVGDVPFAEMDQENWMEHRFNPEACHKRIVSDASGS